MKKLILALLVLSTTLQAQVNSEFKPQIPATCQTRGIKSLNYIKNVKTFENSQLLEISFYTFYGVCNNKKFSIRDFSPFMEIGIYNLGYQVPWRRYYTPTIKRTFIKNNLVKATIAIDKTKIFNKNNSKSYKLKVFPNSKVSYMWNIFLSYKEVSDKTSVRFKHTK